MATGSRRRGSRHRQVLLDALRRLDTHPTAAELHDAIRGRMPRLSLGTVYRNLEILQEEGLVRKLEGVGDKARFDAVSVPHDHAFCVRCEVLFDVPVPKRNRSSPPSLPEGFRVEGRRMQYLGVCADCQRQENGRTPG